MLPVLRDSSVDEYMRGMCTKIIFILSDVPAASVSHYPPLLFDFNISVAPAVLH
jgi:hypothetical protein